jgi:hypothetical protein
LVAIVFVLWIGIALRDACTTTSPAFGPGGAAFQEGAVDADSNASFGREVERNVNPDNDFPLPTGLHQTPLFIVSASLPASSPEPKTQAVRPPFAE